MGRTFAPCVSLLRAAAVSLSTLSQFCIQVSSFIVRVPSIYLCSYNGSSIIRDMDAGVFECDSQYYRVLFKYIDECYYWSWTRDTQSGHILKQLFPFGISGKIFPFHPNPLLSWFWDLKYLFFQLFGVEQMVCSWKKMFNQISLYAVQEYTAQGWKNAKM